MEITITPLSPKSRTSIVRIDGVRVGAVTKARRQSSDPRSKAIGIVEWYAKSNNEILGTEDTRKAAVALIVAAHQR